MKINDALLDIHDGKRLNGMHHFHLQNSGLVDKHGKLTAAGKAAIQPVLDARAASAAKAEAALKSAAANAVKRAKK